MTQQDENRAKWAEFILKLRGMDLSRVNLETLANVETAIRRCPYPNVSDAIMRINGGWLCGEEYELCLAVLLRQGKIEPSGFGSFLIDRRQLPQIEVHNPLADALTINAKPIARRDPVPVPEVEAQPEQGSLFA